MSPEIDETNLPMILAARLCLARTDQMGDFIERSHQNSREGKFDTTFHPPTDVENDAGARFANLIEDVQRAGMPTALAIIEWLSSRAIDGLVQLWGAEGVRSWLQLQILYAENPGGDPV